MKTVGRFLSRSGRSDIQSKVVVQLREKWLTEKLSAEIIAGALERQRLMNPKQTGEIDKQVAQLKAMAKLSVAKLDLLHQYEPNRR